MLCVVRAEFLRLFRWRTFGIGLLVAALIAIIGTFVAHFGTAVPGGTDPTAIRLFRTPRGVSAGLFGPFTVILSGLGSGLVAGLFAVDFSGRTLRTQLVVHPRRSSLLLGKLAAVAIYLLTGAATAVIVAGLLALAIASPKATADGWYTVNAVGDAGITVVVLWAALTSYAMVGFLAAMFTRSPAPAAIIGVLYVTGLDGYLTLALGHVSKGLPNWLPQPNIVALAEGGGGDLTRAIGVVAAFAFILLAAGLGRFVTGDVL